MSYQPLTTANVSALVYGGATFTSGSAASFAVGQTILVINKTTGSPTAVTLPALPMLWETYVVKDGKGDSATNNITITPTSGTIDGNISVTLATNYGAISLIWNGIAWNQTNSAAASGSSSSGSSTTLAANALFVATTGNDSTGTGAVGAPYATISKAITMATSGQTIYVSGGTYTPSAAIPFYASNSGMTLTAYPGQTVIIDGGGTLDPIFSLTQGLNITISNLQVQNSKTSGASYGAFQLSQCGNCTISSNFINTCYNGVTLTGSRSCLIANNRITNSVVAGVAIGASSNNNTVLSNLIDTTTCQGTGITGAGVYMTSGANNQIIHNQIQNCGGAAISINSVDTTTSCLGNIVQYNYCPNNCTSTSATNCGVMYHVNLGKMLTNACLIDTNWFAVHRPLPNTTNVTAAIYLDDYTSGSTVTNNILLGGAFCILVQGGQNNLLKNNVFDMGTVTATTLGAGLFQGLSGFTNGSMGGNQISGNIVYSTASTAPTVWLANGGGTATIVGNFTYNTNAQVMTTNNGISDSSPIATNPQFVNAASGIYDIGQSSVPVFQGFVPINQGLMGLLATASAATSSSFGTPAIINNSVSAGIYTFTTVTVNAQGLITGISSNTSSGAVPTTLTGDVTGTGLGTFTATLAASGVSPGSYQGLIVNAKGIITSAFNAGYLTTNQTISVSGDVFGSGTTSISLALSSTGVTPGTYQGLVINAKGQVMAASSLSYLSANQPITVSGDATGSGATAIALTLSASGVTPGTYQGLVVSSKGLVTSASTISYLSANQTITVSGDVTGSGATAIALSLPAIGTVGTYTKVITDAKGRVSSGSQIASGDVTTALGYTPYNTTNPNNYINANQSITVSGDVTGSGNTAIALTLAATGVLAGTYQGLVINTKGQVISASVQGYSIPSVIVFTATGTIQGNAYALLGALGLATNVPSGSGAILTGLPSQRIFNRGVNDLLVYPPSNGQIEADGTNAPTTIVAGGEATFIMASATQFYVSTTSFA